ncbi:hypothetical protein SUGI_0290190 [Cryptomeria japonica]|nr:hypothetical protein SUGI_0290190 [Cryptomeria japonica]
MRAKYLNSLDFPSVLSMRDLASGSKVWIKILKCKGVIMENLQWRVGDGNIIRFWEDDWMGEGPLNSNLSLREPQSLCKHHFGTLVKDYISPHRKWRIIGLYCTNHPLLTQKALELHNEMSRIRIPLFPRQDNLFWKKENKGDFLVKSAYKALLRNNLPCGPW